MLRITWEEKEIHKPKYNSQIAFLNSFLHSHSLFNVNQEWKKPSFVTLFHIGVRKKNSFLQVHINLFEIYLMSFSCICFCKSTIEFVNHWMVNLHPSWLIVLTSQWPPTCSCWLWSDSSPIFGHKITTAHFSRGGGGSLHHFSCILSFAIFPSTLLLFFLASWDSRSKICLAFYLHIHFLSCILASYSLLV
jgi:hypothetical protein